MGKDAGEIPTTPCFGQAFDAGVPECKQCQVREDCKNKMEGISSKPASPNKKATSNKVVDIKKEEPAKKTSAPAKAAAPAKKPQAAAPAKTTAPAKKAKAADNPDVPDFKGVDIKEVEKHGKERKVDIKALRDKYADDRIYRMRLLMAIKETYK